MPVSFSTLQPNGPDGAIKLAAMMPMGGFSWIHTGRVAEAAALIRPTT